MSFQGLRLSVYLGPAWWLQLLWPERISVGVGSACQPLSRIRVTLATSPLYSVPSW